MLPDGNALPSDWGPIHDLVLGNCLVLVEGVRPASCRLSLYDRNLHVLDLDPDQEEIDLADNHVLQVIFGLVVFELDVEALLYPHLHLDWIVHLWVGGEGVDR